MNPTRIVTIAIIAVALVGVVAVSLGGDRVSRLGDARPTEKMVAPAAPPTQAVRMAPRPWFAPDEGDREGDSGADGDDWGESADRPDVVAKAENSDVSSGYDPGYVANPALPPGVDDAGPDPNAE
jgi:hypothetical protein